MHIENLLLEIKSDSPEILTQPLLKWNAAETEPYLFVKEKFWQDSASVNVFRVVGTQHPDYTGMSWIEFLEKGKRMGINLSLFRENPDYYLRTEKKVPGMYYQSIDGGVLYVGGDGNHRTAIAKAFFYLTGQTTLHGVTVTDYRIDGEMKAAFEEIKETIKIRKLPIGVEFVSKAVSRDDSGGWMLERYENIIKTTEYRSGRDVVLSSASAVKEYLETLKRKSGIFGFLKAL